MSFVEQMLWVDWVILAVVAGSTVIGVVRGFLRETLSLAVWVFALVVTILLYLKMAVLLEPFIESVAARNGAAILVLFIACLLVGGLLNFVIIRLAKLAGLSATDRMLGMVFGFLRGVVVVVMIFMAGKYLVPLQKEVWWQESLLRNHVERLESWTVGATEGMRDLWRSFSKEKQ